MGEGEDGEGGVEEGGDVRYSLGKFFKEVEFKVDLEGNFVVLEANHSEG